MASAIFMKLNGVSCSFFGFPEKGPGPKVPEPGNFFP